MKIGRTYSLSEENVKKLTEIKNASALIDGLLRDFFEKDDSMNKLKELSIPELESLLELENKKETLEEELKSIKEQIEKRTNK